MLLEELTLYNVGPFRGKHVVRFAGPAENGPVTLIGGMNGSGKTTILDAIQLALYGKHASCSKKGKLSYRRFIGGLIHNVRSTPREAAVTFSFVVDDGAQQHHYLVNRSWLVGKNSFRECLRVSVDGSEQTDIAEQWTELVEELIPSRIAPLFFFDGERIEALASPGTAERILKRALEALLGLDLVEQLIEDLRTIDRRNRAGLKKADPRNQEIREYGERQSVLRKDGQRLAQEIARLRGRANRLKRKLEEVDEEFRRQGGELWERRAEIEEERQRLEAKLLEKDESLRELAEGRAPLLIVRELLREGRSLAELVEESRVARQLFDLLTQRDARCVSDLRSAGHGGRFLSALEAWLREDRKRRKREADVADDLPPLPEGAPHHLNELLEHVLPRTLSQARGLLQARQDLAERMARLEALLAATPDDGVLKKILREREQLRGELAAVEQETVRLSAELDNLQRELEEASRKYAQALESLAERHYEHQNTLRLLKHSNRAQHTLKAFRDRVLAVNVGRIRRSILESYQRLSAKGHFITDVSIDPVTYEVHLCEKNKGTIPLSNLSAGERQLLAVAIVWGLSRCAPSCFPVVIDTPLGRLDSVHRENLVREYFPRASKQVVLLSTDEEIDHRLFALLRPHVGRSYLLVYNGDQQCTQIVDGYFSGVSNAASA